MLTQPKVLMTQWCCHRPRLLLLLLLLDSCCWPQLLLWLV
jgi:hypothetical protein